MQFVVVFLFLGLKYYSFSKVKLVDKCFVDLCFCPDTELKKTRHTVFLRPLCVFGDARHISSQLISPTACVWEYNSVQPRCYLGTRDPCQVHQYCILFIYPSSPSP